MGFSWGMFRYLDERVFTFNERALIELEPDEEFVGFRTPVAPLYAITVGPDEYVIAPSGKRYRADTPEGLFFADTGRYIIRKKAQPKPLIEVLSISNFRIGGRWYNEGEALQILHELEEALS